MESRPPNMEICTSVETLAACMQGLAPKAAIWVQIEASPDTASHTALSLPDDAPRVPPAGPGTDVRDLRPELAVPFPRVIQQSGREWIAAEQNGAGTRRVVRHRVTNAGRRSDVFLLAPEIS